MYAEAHLTARFIKRRGGRVVARDAITLDAFKTGLFDCRLSERIASGKWRNHRYKQSPDVTAVDLKTGNVQA
jgi:hypothetical protein